MEKVLGGLVPSTADVWSPDSEEEEEPLPSEEEPGEVEEEPDQTWNQR